MRYPTTSHSVRQAITSVHTQFVSCAHRFVKLMGAQSHDLLSKPRARAAQRRRPLPKPADYTQVAYLRALLAASPVGTLGSEWSSVLATRETLSPLPGGGSTMNQTPSTSSIPSMPAIGRPGGVVDHKMTAMARSASMPSFASPNTRHHRASRQQNLDDEPAESKAARRAFADAERRLNQYLTSQRNLARSQLASGTLANGAVPVTEVPGKPSVPSTLPLVVHTINGSHAIDANGNIDAGSDDRDVEGTDSGLSASVLREYWETPTRRMPLSVDPKVCFKP